MRLATPEQIECLIETAKLRAKDARCTEYTQEQARETVAALEELLRHRRGIPVEGVIRDGMMEAV